MKHEFFFLISEKGQPFSLTQNTEAIKVNTDKSDLKKLSAFQYMT